MGLKCTIRSKSIFSTKKFNITENETFHLLRFFRHGIHHCDY